MIVVGDVHAKFDAYKDIIEDEDCSIQVGDMGFDYRSLDDVSDNHRFIGGNHDNYGNPHKLMLGDFGQWRDIFYIRGAYSIDRNMRTIGVDWFPQEQLSYPHCMDAVDAYDKAKPDIVVTHSAPLSIVTKMGFTAIQTQTQLLLQHCFDHHKPRIWIFGHFHTDWRAYVDSTMFVCLDELSTLRID